MCSVMVCFTSAETTVQGSDIACWGTSHCAMCTVAMVAFGYFVPLSILVAPVLAEANKHGKRIGFVKPYLMCVNLAKVFAIMSILMISSRALPSILISLSLCSFIASMTLIWAMRTSLKQPATSPVVNVCRFLFAFAA